ncbi:MAG: response regulator, partial [Bryobacteraceae bacterium]
GPLDIGVLLVEDQPEVRRFVSEVLRGSGCRVFEAGDALEALRLAETTPDLHLLLTDISMPGLDGEELARELTRRLPRLRVLLISGFARRGDSLSWPVLAKPFSPDRLLAEIRRVVGPLA